MSTFLPEDWQEQMERKRRAYKQMGDDLSDVDTKKNGLSPERKAMMAKEVGTQTAEGNILGGAGTALMMSGDPYAMAAGAGLSTIGAIVKRRRQREEVRRAAEMRDKLNRITGTQRGLQMMSQAFQGAI